jgi:hypothetical protein
MSSTIEIFFEFKVAPYSSKETAVKNKVFTMMQNICSLCEMGIFLEVETLA